eukprot:TRINITY_DN132_c0_g1_i1.p1 TRINITY_DN132_c0_g1~~TRINITY_DN132_c0_g1_i1.p1  ORF type:complete len:179 (+),score=36.92 TRINITY_DN132_c0_g1_i1:45-581(+)
MATEDQKARYTAVFKYQDTNGDGHLKWEDWEGPILKYASNLGLSKDSKECQESLARARANFDRLLKDADKDKDGAVSLDEYIAWASHWGKSGEVDAETRKWFDVAFNIYDLNKNGSLSPNEVLVFLSGFSPKITLDDVKEEFKARGLTDSMDLDNFIKLNNDFWGSKTNTGPILSKIV